MDTHKHEINGEITWTELLSQSDRWSQSGKCSCGKTLSRKTAPPESGYNWEDWKQA